MKSKQLLEEQEQKNNEDLDFRYWESKACVELTNDSSHYNKNGVRYGGKIELPEDNLEL